jgi:glycopeptide antibiotics resistance protein
MIVVIVMGRARGTSGRMIVARCALTGAIARSWRSPFSPSRWTHVGGRCIDSSATSFVPFRTIGTQLAHGLERSEARQLLGNMALFAPLGFLLPFALRSFRRAWPTLLVAAGLSALIETTYQALLPGHSTDVDDVILDSVGAALGFLAFTVTTWMGRKTARDRRPQSLQAPTSV